MSNPPLETGDCSREVEALFELGRSAYAPTEADRARVRSALARRLAEASLTGTWPATLGDGASGLTASNVLAIGVGVACLATFALAFMRVVDARPSRAAPVGAQTRSASEPSNPTRAARVANEARTVTTAPADPEPARTARAQDLAPPIGHTRAPRARPIAPRAAPPTAARSAKRSAVPAATASAASAQAVAVSAADAKRDVTPEPPVAARPSASTPAIAPIPQPAATDSLANQVRPQRSSMEKVRPIGRSQSDARAELDVIARMHAALQQAKPSAVLVLCAEHARRWPHGTFVQEREGLRAVAACNLGAETAGALARAFLISYPQATLTARVRDACGTAP